jgi:hypothetical protein
MHSADSSDAVGEYIGPFDFAQGRLFAAKGAAQDDNASSVSGFRFHVDF